MKNLMFYLGMGTLFAHELDAMPNHEWRVLPLTSWLPDKIGMIAFILIHIPLFAILIALASSTDNKIRARSRLGISIFLIVHSVLHVLFVGHDAYEFSSMLSNGLIFGGALFGLAYLLFEYRENSAKAWG